MLLQQQFHDLCLRIATIDADQLTAEDMYRMAVENNYKYLEEQGIDFVLNEAIRYGLLSLEEFDRLQASLNNSPRCHA